MSASKKTNTNRRGHGRAAERPRALTPALDAPGARGFVHHEPPPPARASRAEAAAVRAALEELERDAGTRLEVATLADGRLWAVLVVDGLEVGVLVLDEVRRVDDLEDGRPRRVARTRCRPSRGCGRGRR